jgi:cytochrome P450
MGGIALERVVDELIDSFVDRDRADLVSEFTFAFPAKVISGVLGLPEEHYRQFQEWAVGIISIGRNWERAVLRKDQDEAQQVDSHIHGDLLFRSPNHLPVIWDCR